MNSSSIHIGAADTGPARVHSPRILHYFIALVHLATSALKRIRQLKQAQDARLAHDLERTRAMPNVPTVAEAGLPELDACFWFGMVAPAGVPRDAVLELPAETVNAFAPAEVRQRLEGLGTVVIASTPEEFAKLQKREIT